MRAHALTASLASDSDAMATDDSNAVSNAAAAAVAAVDDEENAVLDRINQLQHGAAGVASELTGRRHYAVVRDGALEFDPRFAVFEYIFDMMLRKRQVEIVRSFASDMQAGHSRVQQMIMGAGKTTVVGPLLTLMLADGSRCVTHVMPSALLEQVSLELPLSSNVLLLFVIYFVWLGLVAKHFA